MKVCVDCGRELAMGRFASMPGAPDGREARCKECRDIPVGKRGESILRECHLCGEIKLLKFFGKIAAGRLGYSGRCKDCVHKSGREYTGRSVASLVRAEDYEQLMKERVNGQQNRNAWMADKRARGICISCGKRAAKIDSPRCKACLESRRLRYTEQKGERVRFRRDHGICESCGVELEEDRVGHSWRCEPCAKKKAKRQAVKSKRHRPRRRMAEIRKGGDKAKILAMYGKVCACCGEANSRFLTVDHVNNDGKQDRATGGGWGKSTKRLLKFKRDDIQILCYNCNMGKEKFSGTCPHKILMRGKGWNVVKTA